MNPNIVTVSPKYQIVIPKAVRESAGIKPGTKMMVIGLGGVIRLMPIKPATAYRDIARGLDATLPTDSDRFAEPGSKQNVKQADRPNSVQRRLLAKTAT